MTSSSQHLADEAVAAFADGVLGGPARRRAAEHVARCPECADAVRVQHEAALTLRAASAPCLPSGLVDRLRGLPATTAVPSVPVVTGPDGTPMISTLPPGAAGMTSLGPEPASRRAHPHRNRSLFAGAALVLVAGAVAAGAGLAAAEGSTPTTATLVRKAQPAPADPGGSAPARTLHHVSVLRPDGP